MVIFSWFTAAVGAAAVMASVDGAVTDRSHHSHPVIPISSPGLHSKRIAKDTTQTGNWTKIRCTNEFSQHTYSYTPSEQWRGLAADDAWRDIVMLWNNSDRANYNYTMTFLDSVKETIAFDYTYNTGCDQILYGACSAVQCPNDTIDRVYPLDSGYRSGAAATLIWNSLSTIHDIHSYVDGALILAVDSTNWKRASLINRTALTDMEKTFAPASEPMSKNISWSPLLADLTTLGTVSVVGSSAISILNRRPWFSDKSPDKVKNTTMTLLRPWIALARAGLSSSERSARWEDFGSIDFSRVMTRAIEGWLDLPQLAMKKLFDGSPESIEVLGDAMADGKLLEEGKWAVELPYVPARLDLDPIVAKTFFGYAIPALWRLSNTYAFIIDSGFGCDADKPLGVYLTRSTMDATGACVDGKQYYLVHPAGSSSSGRFSAPPGVNRLTGFGGVTKEDLIKGSVRTWIQNDKKNSGGFADPTNNATYDSLLDVDITAPGFIRLPVCSPEVALHSWGTGSLDSSANYPCDVTPSTNGGRDSAIGYSRTIAVVFLFALLHIT